jgi:hypothetical protein
MFKEFVVETSLGVLGMGPDGQESEIPKCTASLARLLFDVGGFGFLPLTLWSDRFSGTIIKKDNPPAVFHWPA